MVQRSVADRRAERGVVGAAQGGEPLLVGLLVCGGQHGLTLGDPQRVRRHASVEPQQRIGPADLGGEEIADGAEEFGTGRPVVGRDGLVAGVLQRIGHGQRRGVAQREQDVVLLLADAAAEHRELDR